MRLVQVRAASGAKLADDLATHAEATMAATERDGQENAISLSQYSTSIQADRQLLSVVSEHNELEKRIHATESTAQLHALQGRLTAAALAEEKLSTQEKALRVLDEDVRRAKEAAEVSPTAVGDKEDRTQASSERAELQSQSERLHADIEEQVCLQSDQRSLLQWHETQLADREQEDSTAKRRQMELSQRSVQLEQEARQCEAEEKRCAAMINSNGGRSYAADLERLTETERTGLEDMRAQALTSKAGLHRSEAEHAALVQRLRASECGLASCTAVHDLDSDQTADQLQDELTGLEKTSAEVDAARLDTEERLAGKRKPQKGRAGLKTILHMCTLDNETEDGSHDYSV